jgi:hypothetical protein
MMVARGALEALVAAPLVLAAEKVASTPASCSRFLTHLLRVERETGLWGAMAPIKRCVSCFLSGRVAMR